MSKSEFKRMLTMRELPPGWTIIMDDSLDGDPWWYAKHSEFGRTDTYRQIETVVRAIEKGEIYNVNG